MIYGTRNDISHARHCGIMALALNNQRSACTGMHWRVCTISRTAAAPGTPCTRCTLGALLSRLGSPAWAYATMSTFERAQNWFLEAALGRIRFFVKELSSTSRLRKTVMQMLARTTGTLPGVLLSVFVFGPCGSYRTLLMSGDSPTTEIL